MDTLVYCALLLLGAFWILRDYVSRNILKPPFDNIPGPPAKSFWKGNLSQFFGRDCDDFQRDVALTYGPVVRMRGLFGRAILYVSDPVALNTVVIKEDHIFEKPERAIASAWVVPTAGEAHRKQRKMLNPVFSVAHMRTMLPIFYAIAHKLRTVIAARVDGGAHEVDVLNWMGRAALELIGQGGLGYSFDPLVGDADTTDGYGAALKALLLTRLHIVLRRVFPYAISLPYAPVQDVRAIIDTMNAKARGIYEAKRAAMEGADAGGQEVRREVRANTAASAQDRLSEEEVIAQMSIFLFAATDTTSNTTARILQLLAQHSDVQDRLRKEILDAGAGEGLSYDELNHLPLLDAVCRETLRLYPPVTSLTRVTNKDTVLPLSRPIRGTDGTIMSEIPVMKGTEIMMGIFGANANQEMWGEDALEWRPERWLAPLPQKVTGAPTPGVYSHLMSFSGGKKACIGFKFAETEMKVVLSVLLSTFHFELTWKPITWNAAGVQYPTVGKDDNTPQLPLKVKPLSVGKA
ncbi:cytochrome P450 [Wolfiporia cocos MD-104 SS10]|uniref:Cytochrome P450 n=1 Tax=Wolfiporia cocos (strain MD-104) TaxID=742152 RepID=A0A2H3JG28_WOLCO|nr:cytochrome P450 [Wolfiporia cocos MD-104 SS10]